MSAEQISCALLAAASLTTGVRRIARTRNSDATQVAIDPLGAAVASARNRARLLYIPDSAINTQLERARKRGQSDLSALNELIEQAGRDGARG
jgi:hypothetical protein